MVLYESAQQQCIGRFIGIALLGLERNKYKNIWQLSNLSSSMEEKFERALASRNGEPEAEMKESESETDAAKSFLCEIAGSLIRSNDIDLTPLNGTLYKFVNFYMVVKQGSHVAVQCKSGVFHHGIYCKFNEIIHFSGDTKDDAVISTTSVDDFSTQPEFYLISYPGENDHTRCLSIEIATTLCNRFGHVKGLYHIFKANCECFAIYCKTGDWRLNFSNLQIKYLDLNKQRRRMNFKC